MVTPPLHQGYAPFKILGAIIDIADFIFAGMGKGSFNDIQIKPLFIQGGAGYGAQAVCDQSFAKAHPFQGHVGGLRMGMRFGVTV